MLLINTISSDREMSGRFLLMSGRELRPCGTFCPAELNTPEISDKENKNAGFNIKLPYL